ncbi:helix-turn-helix domain-containing protein [Hymenobacter cheonanensis]|uniref:helix-turn-helix domain-containing protein n=1 Tax=Hymenobacter sp. CA2-7 TaxID=3063993 RepID=UPI0027130C0A|nr:helix-turn-helix transcriptional regulator [Hymenobacter sp. CA2-7]MDO7887604.1 helix-turn-helix transcriptional regulator [Hymenobacter sp. CA2-7]
MVIRELRLLKKLSQEALSDKAGLDRTFLSQLETGRKQPSLLTIFRLAAALGLSTSELLSKTETRLEMGKA